jgi:O-succinylbenzoic acid--CoA ligase
LAVDRFLDQTALVDLIGEINSIASVDEEGQDLDDRAVATIVFSSGSTSQPKAIAHDLHAHLASASGSNQNLPIGMNDRWLLALPLNHVSGLGVLFRCCLAGAQIVVARGEPIREAIERLQPSHVSLVPTQLKQLREECVEPPASLRAILLGGSSWPVEMVRTAVEDDWPVLTTYGLSEMASQVTTTHLSTRGDQVGTSGRTLAGRELQISDSGEILVRGDTLFRGYVNGSELRRPLDESGWFHTGDLGRMDRDGYLTVVGRRDNMFVSGGENIYPEEIEARLLEIERVHQAIVVPVSDSQFGQRPVAFVDSDQLVPDVWRERLQQHLPRFKLPDRFLGWPHHHISQGIKPDRRRLAELAEQQV